MRSLVQTTIRTLMRPKKAAICLVLAAVAASLLAPVASAGEDWGRVDARFYSGSYEQGAINASIVVTATPDPGGRKATGSEFTVTYDSRALKFLTNYDGTCDSHAVTSDPAVPVDTALTCQVKPGSLRRESTFLFSVKADAPVGKTTAYANVSYGNTRASTNGFSTQITSARPQCASSDFNFRGFCIPNTLTSVIDVVKRANKCNQGQCSEQQKRQLVLDVATSKFWKQVGALVAKEAGKNAGIFVTQFVTTFLANQGRAS